MLCHPITPFTTFHHSVRFSPKPPSQLARGSRSIILSFVYDKSARMSSAGKERCCSKAKDDGEGCRNIGVSNQVKNLFIDFLCQYTYGSRIS